MLLQNFECLEGLLAEMASVDFGLGRGAEGQRGLATGHVLLVEDLASELGAATFTSEGLGISLIRIKQWQVMVVPTSTRKWAMRSQERTKTLPQSKKGQVNFSGAAVGRSSLMTSTLPRSYISSSCR